MWWNGTSEKKLSSNKEGREHCLFFQTGQLIYGHLAGRRLPENENPHHKILQITAVNGGDKRLYVIGQINNISSRMVVDTGANVSIIRKDSVQNLVLSGRRPSLEAGVLIASFVVVLSNLVILLRIANISDRTRTIQEGEVKAACAPVTCVERKSDTQDLFSEDLVKDLLQNTDLDEEKKCFRRVD
ncbi:hypothetical protein TNCV_4244591 [Trichonephila clavipes]|nr:hypothetical protein TNCV_4244591 [Trichonephila clavipes]